MKIATLLLVSVLLLAGCKLPQGNVISVTQSVIGIKVGQNPATQTPELQIGFFRSTFQIVPTSSNQIYAPMVNSSLSLDQKSWVTSIDEEFLTGGATASPDSVAQRGALARGKTPLATKAPLPKSMPPCPCTNAPSITAPTSLVTPDVATNAAFTSGIAVVFESAPSAEIIALLNAAEAAHNPENTVFIIEPYDRFHAAQNAAIEASLRAGALLRPKD